MTDAQNSGINRSDAQDTATPRTRSPRGTMPSYPLSGRIDFAVDVDSCNVADSGSVYNTFRIDAGNDSEEPAVVGGFYRDASPLERITESVARQRVPRSPQDSTTLQPSTSSSFSDDRHGRHRASYVVEGTTAKPARVEVAGFRASRSQHEAKLVQRNTAAAPTPFMPYLQPAREPPTTPNSYQDPIIRESSSDGARGDADCIPIGYEVPGPQNSHFRWSPPKALTGSSTAQAARNTTVPAIRLSVVNTPGTTENLLTRTSSDTSSADVCIVCEELGDGRYYCNVCQDLFCDPCWNTQITHRRQSKTIMPGTLPHEKTKRSIAEKVKKVLTPALTKEDRERLHLEDIDTTWFGVSRSKNQPPLFRDYGRYANLIATLKTERYNQYYDDHPSSPVSKDQIGTLFPSLVSFVGVTGAGKSTLIKFLIDLKSNNDTAFFPTPVVGAPDASLPTSGDVHLYLDPVSSMSLTSQSPLLYADCEGLDGGERNPFAAATKQKFEGQGEESPSSTTDQYRPKRLNHISERELMWANNAQRGRRDYTVEYLYPRLLYTFSDVIVFVAKDARLIEKVVERLINWAHAALEKSSNQPVLPHAIIVLNASNNDIPEKLWDVKCATKTVMDKLDEALLKNPSYQHLVNFWKERRRPVRTVTGLVRMYYSSLNIVRVPTTGRPNLITDQITKLSDVIRTGSEAARESKARLRMLLNADEFQLYLQSAFDHFAENLSKPFDFVQASFANSPIPNNFGGNILKLAIQMMTTWNEIRNPWHILQELSFIVGSCIMLDTTRQKIRGVPQDMFPKYLPHLDQALMDFCDKHWRCEYQHGAERCVNVRSGHSAKGHQMQSGRLAGVGHYKSTIQCDEPTKRKFQELVYEKLVISYVMTRRRTSSSKAEDRAAAEIHCEYVLPHFFAHVTKHDPGTFVSHTVCLSCLFEPPEHALPCGHIICTPCLRSFGDCPEPSRVAIPHCPLEPKTNRFIFPWEVYLKPPGCGIRILTLDGGGIRGVVELEILKLLAAEFDNDINIQSFFDLIVGTSTGGIIALGMVERKWTIQQCSEKFEKLCVKAFVPRKGVNIPVIGRIVAAHKQSKYETKPLEEALQTAFTEHEHLFGGKRARATEIGVKVAITATSATLGEVVFANYSRTCGEQLSYAFQRPETLQGEVKTWEAARATSAAPRYFKNYYHKATKQLYSDGGIYHNNPINVADSERKLLWPELKDNEPDIVISIGTGSCVIAKEKALVSSPSNKGIVAGIRNMNNLASHHIHSSLDARRTWREFIRVRNPKGDNKQRYVRLDPEFEEPLPKLDHIRALLELKASTVSSMKRSEQIKAVAQRIAATLFYFEVASGVNDSIAPTSEMVSVVGNFHCRLQKHEIPALSNFIKKHKVPGYTPRFIIMRSDSDTDIPQLVYLNDQVLDRMSTKKSLNIYPPTTVTWSSKQARTEIFLCLDKSTRYPISGFPRKLHEGKTPITGSRQILTSVETGPWIGHSASAHARDHAWDPPLHLSKLQKTDIIERFADASHLLGSATKDDLNPNTPPEPPFESEEAYSQSTQPQHNFASTGFTTLPPSSGYRSAAWDSFELAHSRSTNSAGYVGSLSSQASAPVHQAWNGYPPSVHSSSSGRAPSELDGSSMPRMFEHYGSAERSQESPVIAVAANSNESYRHTGSAAYPAGVHELP